MSWFAVKNATVTPNNIILKRCPAILSEILRLRRHLIDYLQPAANDSETNTTLTSTLKFTNYLNTFYVTGFLSGFTWQRKSCYFSHWKNKEISVQRVKCFTEEVTSKVELTMYFLKQLYQLNTFQFYNSSSIVLLRLRYYPTAFQRICIWPCHNYFSVTLPANNLLSPP